MTAPVLGAAVSAADIAVTDRRLVLIGRGRGQRRHQRRRGAPNPTSASPWAAAPTWPSGAPNITLVAGNLRGLVLALELSRATMRNMKENLVFAFGYDTAAISVAADLLYSLSGCSCPR